MDPLHRDRPQPDDAAPPDLPAGFLPALADAAARLERETDLHAAAALFLSGLRDHFASRKAVLAVADAQGHDHQWFFTGLSIADISWFHTHQLNEAERQALLTPERRDGRTFSVPVPQCPRQAGLRLNGSQADLLFLPLSGHGGAQLGTLVVDDGRPRSARSPAIVAALELWTQPLARLLERKRLDHTARNTEMRLRQAQEQLMQADKLSSIGQLISGVAHELNNPLSGVLGFTQLLQASETSPKAKRGLDRIYGEAVRCQKIVQNLLGFARRYKPEKIAHDLVEVVEGVLDLRAYQLAVDNVEIERRYEKNLPPTLLDAHQIQQVVLNLVNNAHQAMMTVTDRPRRLSVALARREDRLHVAIGDTGPGIPPDRLARLFEPFFTTKEPGKGTGLGLSVSLGIVKDHMGNMSVDSAIGRGSTFWFDLPIVAVAASDGTAAAAATTSAKPPHAAGLRVLIVDDEPVLRELLMDLLKSAGHEVESARDGRAALRLALEGRFDVILSDLKMPGLDGQGLYESVCRERPEMARRFVFTTGDVVNPDAEGFLQDSGCAYLSKPFKLETILAVVDQSARRKAA
ncbi:MAG TPA: ATP-binding protein [Candidatus Polarisedimenticolia bacterium]|nr:ATP-binding protein [Candidatus Polarisedimenticolia bacterium]